jgi:hypothetical protein
MWFFFLIISYFSKRLTGADPYGAWVVTAISVCFFEEEVDTTCCPLSITVAE